MLDDLKAKLNNLATVSQHPDLLLSEYFDNLRREIDLEAETCILEAGDIERVDRINKIRELLIAELNKQEVRLRGAKPNELRANKLESLRQRLSELEEHYQMSADGYQAILLEIEAEAKKFQTNCLKNQSFFFLAARHFKKLQDFGVLIRIADITLDEIGSENLQLLDHLDLSYTFEVSDRNFLELAKSRFVDFNWRFDQVPGE